MLAVVTVAVRADLEAQRQVGAASSKLATTARANGDLLTAATIYVR